MFAMDFGTAATQIWQVTLSVMLVAVIGRLLRGRSPHVMHGLWFVVLIKCLTPPVLTSPSGCFCWLQPPGRVANDEAFPESLVRPKQSAMTLDSQRTIVVVAGTLDEPRSEASAIAMNETRPLPSSTSFESRKNSPRSGTKSWQPVVLAIWLGGFLIVLMRQVLGLSRLWRRIQAGAVSPHSDWQTEFQEIRDRLKVTRRARLLVTRESTGPAVIGLLCPRVVVPLPILEQSSRDFRVTVFTHELLHVRRGDLWVCSVQQCCAALWWFHPLVHFAIRRLGQAVECCCDESVIAELKISPGNYARHLIKVLECKAALRTLEPLPGIRAKDITSTRLERVMRLGQGCRSRMPWWAWLAMAVVACVILPGGAFVVGQEKKTERSKAIGTARAESGRNADAASDGKAALQKKDEGELKATPLPAAYWLKDDVQYFAPSPEPSSSSKSVAAKRIYSSPAAAQNVQEEVTPPLPKVEATFDLTDAIKKLLAEKSADDRNEAVKILSDWLASTAGEKQPLSIEGNQLTLLCNEPAREKVTKELEHIERMGIRCVVMEVLFVEGPRDSIQELSAEWALLGSGPIENDLLYQRGVPAGIERKQDATTLVRRVIEETEVLKEKVLDAAEFQLLADRVKQGDFDSVMAPRCLSMNGRSAFVVNYTQRPFVTGFSRHIAQGDFAQARRDFPIVRIVDSGLSLKLRPECLENGMIWLDSKCTLADIVDCKERDVSIYGESGEIENATVQLPVISRTIIEASKEIPAGGGLAIAGIQRREHTGDDKVMMLLIRCQETGIHGNRMEQPAAVAKEPSAIQVAR